MTRRLRIAGAAFGAMLVPACAGLDSDPPRIKPVSASPPTAPVGYRAMPGITAAQAAKPRTVEKFAESRAEATPTIEQRPVPVSEPMSPIALAPVEHQVTVETPPAPLAPIAPVDTPRLTLPGRPRDTEKPAPEPTPDAEGVIRSPWPVIPGVRPAPETPIEPVPKLVLPVPGDATPPAMTPTIAPPMLPPTPKPAETPAVLVPAPMAAPPALPPGVIGSSIHQANSSPVAAASSIDTPLPGELATAPAQPTGDSQLIQSIRAFQQNRPDEAVEYLKGFDPATQQILLSLMPALARVGDGKLQQMRPEEIDVVLDQLTKVPNILRPRASLQAANVRLCREVHNFGHVEAFADRHEFYPGDIVYLYLELANFSCVPEPKGGYTVTLASSLEMKDSAGAAVWRADPKVVPDTISTPPQDYYRNFRLCVPNVPPGAYTLTVKTIDRPTGRTVSKTVDLLVGSR